MYRDIRQWREIRRRILEKGAPKKRVSAETGISRKTINKMLAHEQPPGYRRRRSRYPKLAPHIPTIDRLLRDKRVTSICRQDDTALRVTDEGGDGQGEIGDVGKRVAGIDGQRREHGEHALLVDLGHRLAVGDRQVAPPHDGDAGGGERRGQRVDEHELLALDEPARRLG